MKFIIGKKIGMTQLWDDKGNMVAVTKVKADPCFVSQIRTLEKDKYNAIQFCGGVKKAKNIAKPQIGHLKKAQTANKEVRDNIKFFREFRLENNQEAGLNLGDKITLESFATGDKIDVVAISKGYGFQGVVKRHGFKGHKKTHGTKDQVRMPGSIGATGPQRVFKGIRMGGRMGSDRTTIKNSQVMQIDNQENIIFVKGPVPGGRNTLVEIIGK